MTFDEIFQQYVAQGFTKPTASVAGIETLMPTTATIAPITPIQIQNLGGGQGQDYDPTKDTTPTADLGFNSFSDLFDRVTSIPGMINEVNIPGMVGGMIAGIPGAIIGRGVDYFSGRGDPYGGFDTRGISPDVQAAIEKDIQREAKDYNTGGDGGKNGGGGFSGYGTSAERGAAIHG